MKKINRWRVASSYCVRTYTYTTYIYLLHQDEIKCLNFSNVIIYNTLYYIGHTKSFFPFRLIRPYCVSLVALYLPYYHNSIMSASSFHSDQSFTRALLYIIILLGIRSRKKNLFKKHGATSLMYRFCFPHTLILFIIIAPKTRNRPVEEVGIENIDNLWYLLYMYT